MPVNLPNPTDLAVPAFVMLMLLEIWHGWRNGRTIYEKQDTFTSLAMGLGSTLSGLLVAGFYLWFAYKIYDYRLFDIGHAWWVLPIAFVLADFRMYWQHRLQHRCRWFWAAHVIHHSSQHYNLSTALRQTWTGPLTPEFLLGVPFYLAGFDPAIMVFCMGLNLVYQFWVHTEAVDKMPRWFEAVMNTPSHHRVHHAKNPRYLDANYGGVFIIWDKIFGSFVAEDPAEKPDYGLVSDLGTFNILRVAIHEWISIARDMWLAPTISAKIKYLIREPGWSHDNSRKTSDMLRQEWQAREKPAE